MPSERASRREATILAALAMVGPTLALLAVLSQPPAERFNDYHDYWLAGRLVGTGLNPCRQNASRF